MSGVTHLYPPFLLIYIYIYIYQTVQPVDPWVAVCRWLCSSVHPRCGCSGLQQDGSSVNISKKEMVCQWRFSVPHTPPVFTIDHKPLTITPSFKFLSSVLSEDCSINHKVQNPIRWASAASGTLRHQVFRTTTSTYTHKLLIMKLSASPPSSTAMKHGSRTAITLSPWSASI